MSKEREYPDWWIKQQEETLGKDNPWLNFIKKHDRIPTDEELYPDKIKSTLAEIEDLDEISDEKLYTSIQEALDDIGEMVDEARRRNTALRIALKKKEELKNE